jgi:hypothetical protein
MTIKSRLIAAQAIRAVLLNSQIIPQSYVERQFVHALDCTRLPMVITNFGNRSIIYSPAIFQ